MDWISYFEDHLCHLGTLSQHTHSGRCLWNMCDGPQLPPYSA